MVNVGSMDVLTGRITREVYFDPANLVGKDGKLIAASMDEDKLAEMLYKPMKVVQELPNEKIVIVRDALDQVHRLLAEGLLTVKPEATQGVPDILDLNDFSEMSLLETLRSRYGRDEVYTFVGPILISINPYKWNHVLYTEAAMIHYHTAEREALAPHLFKVADASYVAFINDGSKVPANQSIIISGESGAGKTEAMKIIMQYLARITHYKVTPAPTHTHTHTHTQDTTPHLEVGELERKVLSTNPFLESFGNAKTLMNDNSSRFGKYVKIQFGPSGRIVGAEITNYLLEKTRIVRQAEGERNFHIFYQLIRGGEKGLLKELGLDGEEGSGGFRYLTHGHCTEIEGKSDVEDFKVTMECMAAIGLDEKLQKTMLELVAAVLHLGNVSFVDTPKEGEGSSAVDKATREHLKVAAKFLRLDAGEMEKTFCSKQITTRKDEVLVKPNDATEASDKRDTLAKTVYSCVFNWLVRRLNLTIAAGGKEKCWGFMGVLDIYGFEAFEHNSFEQLLINFANETLQNQFNRHIFEMEQEDYDREGIDWSYVSFNDNQPCLALLDSRYYREPSSTSAGGGEEGGAGAGAVTTTATGKSTAACLFNILDDVKSVGGGPGASHTSDSRFLSALNTTFAGKSEAFVKPRLHSDVCFGVKHYAGTVLYHVDGFVERNVENLHQNVRALALGCTDPLIRDDIFLDIKTMEEKATHRGAGGGAGGATPNKKGRGGGGGKAAARLREASLSSQFRTSLATLVETLDMTTPRYVRCIKPNHEKLPGHFHTAEILRQLKYAGMMEAIRIRQQGYALREPHSLMYKQFSRLVPGCKSLPELIEKLSVMLNVDEREWQMGVSKVFMRKSMAEKLARLLELRVKLSTRTIQRAWARVRQYRAAVRLQASMRRYLAQRRFRVCVRGVLATQARWRMRVCRRGFVAQRAAAVKVQAEGRRFLAMQQYRRLNNPYNKMDEDTLIRTSIELEGEAKVAEEKKDFEACTVIAGKLRMLETALVQVREMMDPLPYTRAQLDAKVVEVEGQIEEMSRKKNYTACSKLQAEMASLVGLRKLLPTRAEVLEEIGALQATIDEHFRSKNFKACDEVQLQVKVMEVKYKQVLNAKEPSPAEATGFGSRRELEGAVKKAEGELARLEAEKNFAACQKAQAEVTRLVGLRRLFPTVLEKEGEIVSLEAAVKQAAQDRKYTECDRLQQLVEEAKVVLEELRVQEKIEEETSVERDEKQKPRSPAKVKKTRPELEAAVGVVKKKQAERLAAKDFAACDALQKELDELEAELATLPTLAQLEGNLGEVKKEMDKLLAAKNFAACEPLQAKIDALQAEVKAMRAAMPAEPIQVLSSARAAAGCASPSRSGVSVAASARLSPLKSRKSSSLSMAKGGLSPAKSTVGGGGNNSKASGCPVSKLRPDKPLLLSASTNVTGIAQTMLERRAAAVLLVDEAGQLNGILTDTDVTRRVVAQDLLAESTTAAVVMTPSPTTVSLEDDSLDALTLMVKGGFRHLPVVDAEGGVVGCLDIAKCLNDAITRLERMEAHREKQSAGKAEKQREAASMAALALAGGAGGGKGGSRGAKQQQTALLSTLVQLLSANGANASGGDEAPAMPTVSVMLAESSAAALLPKDTSVSAASKEMATARKGCLVVEGGKLIGLVTFKDVLKGVVAAQRSPEGTTLEEIMTKHPEAVTPDMSLLDTLYMMRDGHFLNVPVVEEGSGKALGLLSAMDIVQCLTRLSGKDDGGRAFWAFAMGEGEDDWDSAASDAGSARSSLSQQRRHQRGTASPAKSTMSRMQEREQQQARAVAKLRPEGAVLVPTSTNISQIAKVMVERRAAAVLLVGENNTLSGILTDTDVTRRVVAQDLSSAGTPGGEVMTANPTTVSLEDDCLDALTMMVKGGFRHLPVLDAGGDVVGCLDIAKCLNDAITRLERMEARREKAAVAAGKSGGGKQQLDAAAVAMALAGAGGGKGGKQQQTALLSTLVQLLSANGGGGSETEEGTALPTVEVMLAECPAAALLPKDTPVSAAAKEMAAARKACLIVEGEQLVGLVTFKDVLKGVVAKDKSPDTTTLGEIMTKHPEAVTPDMSLLDALYKMRDGHFLNLPVVEADTGRPLGLLSVMEIVQSLARLTGKDDGGRSFWESTMGEGEDGWESQSDAGSAHSAFSQRRRGRGGGAEGGVGGASAPVVTKTVAKLRPDKPLVVAASTNIADLAQAMVERRAAAVLLVDEGGVLSGILTDTDVTRRVVAKDLPAENTKGVEVMTANPTTVRMEDDCLDALTTMVKGSFRHLPVLDKEEGVVGCLDIAKCLNDAITRLERMEAHRENQAAGKQGGEGKQQQLDATAVALALAGKSAAGGKGGKQQQTALLSTLVQLLAANSGAGAAEDENALPTVESMLEDSPAAALLSEETSVSAASKKMAAARKACLVVEEEKLIGIVTFKDILKGVVAERLSPETTTLSQIMTRRPEAVTPDMSLLDALYKMRDGHFLNLPVVEADTGRALGLLSAMEIVQSIARLTGQDDGGRSFWESTMGGGGGQGEDGWETGSDNGSARSAFSRGPPKARGGGFRPVSSLKPKSPLVVNEHVSVLETVKAMVQYQTDAALVVSNSGGGVVGILTDNDVTRRVVGASRPAERTPVSEVMTGNPKTVLHDSDSIEALTLMVKNRFRHLPVIGREGSVSGLLDIAKCMHDAIRRVEKKEEKNAVRMAEMNTAIAKGGEAAMFALLGMLSGEGTNESSNPTLRSVLERHGPPNNKVLHTKNVQEAAAVMSATRKAALVMDEDDNLLGIFTPKDMCSRVVAKERDLMFTSIASVMTLRPETIDAEETVLDALYLMRARGFLHLPVTDRRSGEVLGMVDVMDIVQTVLGGEDGGRRFWAQAQTGEDDDTNSELSSHVPHRSRYPGSGRGVGGHRSGVGLDPDEQRHMQAYPIDPCEELDSVSVLAGGGHHRGGGLHIDANTSILGASTAIGGSSLLVPPAAARSRAGSSSVVGPNGESAHVRLKVVAEDGATKTVTAPTESFEACIDAIGKALDLASTNNRALTYVDEQKDVITVDTDEGLEDMITFAHDAGMKVLKVTLIRRRRRRSSGGKGGVGVGGGMSVAVVAVGSTVAMLAMVGLMVMSRRTNK